MNGSLHRRRRLSHGGPSTGTLLLDTFTDTNGDRISTQHTMDVGAGWTEHSGDFIIQTNRAKLDVVGGEGVATADAGKSDVTVTVTVNSANVNNVTGIAGRLSDTSNLWLIGFSTGVYRILEKVANSYTARASAVVVVISGVDYALAATFAGANISATLDGANAISYGSATSNQTVKRFGIRGGTIGDLWDNFQVVG